MDFFHVEYNNDGSIKSIGQGLNKKTFYKYEDWILFQRIMTLEMNIINKKNIEESKKELEILKTKNKKLIKVATVFKIENSNINKN